MARDPVPYAIHLTRPDEDLGIEFVHVHDEQTGSEGVVLVSTDPGGPASRAKLPVGWKVHTCDGVPVHTPADLRSAVQRLRTRREMHPEILMRPASGPYDFRYVLQLSRPGEPLGIEFGVHQQGTVMVREVKPGSAAARAGVPPGRLLLSVDGVKVRQWSDLAAAEQQLRRSNNLAPEVVVGLPPAGDTDFAVPQASAAPSTESPAVPPPPSESDSGHARNQSNQSTRLVELRTQLVQTKIALKTASAQVVSAEQERNGAFAALEADRADRVRRRRARQRCEALEEPLLERALGRMVLRMRVREQRLRRSKGKECARVVPHPVPEHDHGGWKDFTVLRLPPAC